MCIWYVHMMYVMIKYEIEELSTALHSDALEVNWLRKYITVCSVIYTCVGVSV